MHVSRLFINSYYGMSPHGIQEYLGRWTLSWPVVPIMSSEEFWNSMSYFITSDYMNAPEFSYDGYRKLEFAQEGTSKNYINEMFVDSCYEYEDIMMIQPDPEDSEDSDDIFELTLAEDSIGFCIDLESLTEMQREVPSSCLY